MNLNPVVLAAESNLRMKTIMAVKSFLELSWPLVWNIKLIMGHFGSSENYFNGCYVSIKYPIVIIKILP